MPLMSENPFINKYKTLSNYELLDIVNKVDEYQPLAVEAAKQELNARNLSTDEYELAQRVLIESQSETSHLTATERIIIRLKEVYNSITAQDRRLTPSGIIDIISIIIIVQFAYKIITSFSFLTLLIFDGGSWDISTLYYVLPFAILPIAGITLILRKQIGWILTVIHFCFLAASSIPILIFEIRMSQQESTILDSLFPSPSPISLILAFIIYSLLVWTMCKKNITTVFKISKLEIAISLGIGVGLLVLQRI